MSKENAKQFLKAYKNDEKAIKLLEEYPDPKSPDEGAAQVLEVAGKLGIQITKEEMAEAIRELQEEQRARTDEAVNDMAELDDADLENVAGGVYRRNIAGKRLSGCDDTFVSGEFCMFTDACDKALTFYYDCDEQYFPDNADYACSFVDVCPGTYWKENHCSGNSLHDGY